MTMTTEPAWKRMFSSGTSKLSPHRSVDRDPQDTGFLDAVNGCGRPGLLLSPAGQHPGDDAADIPLRDLLFRGSYPGNLRDDLFLDGA